jgi:replicative DNA helicase
MSEARFQAVADLLDGWRDDVLSGKPPTLYPIGDGDLARIEIGPGLVTLLGGAPGAGKTALTMQLTCEALERTPGLRALVCNVEMSPAILLDRQLARLSCIDLSLIRHRKLGAEHADAIERGMSALERFADRLAFARPPFDLANVAASADAFDAGLIVLDYVQRIGAFGEHGDRRGAVDATMSHLRQFADAGTALIVVAALARSKDSKGRSSYSEGLSLASFRESSELEFGADDAFILAPDDGEGAPPSRVILKYLKSRLGEARDIALAFDKPRQRFTPAEPTEPPKRADKGKLQTALRALWESTGPSDEGEGDAG